MPQLGSSAAPQRAAVAWAFLAGSGWLTCKMVGKSSHHGLAGGADAAGNELDGHGMANIKNSMSMMFGALVFNFFPCVLIMLSQLSM